MDYLKNFCNIVFPIISKQFVAVVNDIFRHESLSPSQRHGLITLICKDPDNPDQLKNWHPISLLNVDYKIISKVLSIRLGSVLSNIHLDHNNLVVHVVFSFPSFGFCFKALSMFIAGEQCY